MVLDPSKVIREYNGETVAVSLRTLLGINHPTVFQADFDFVGDEITRNDSVLVSEELLEAHKLLFGISAWGRNNEKLIADILRLTYGGVCPSTRAR